MSAGRTVTITQALREDLLDAIQQVKLGKMKAADALAIASLSSQVIAAAKLELEVAKFRVVREMQLAAPTGAIAAQKNGHGESGGGAVADVAIVAAPAAYPARSSNPAKPATAETIPATIRDRALAQAREALRARMIAGETAAGGSELELSISNDYGLSPKVVQALVREISHE